MVGSGVPMGRLCHAARRAILSNLARNLKSGAPPAPRLVHLPRDATGFCNGAGAAVVAQRMMAASPERAYDRPRTGMTGLLVMPWGYCCHTYCVPMEKVTLNTYTTCRTTCAPPLPRGAAATPGPGNNRARTGVETGAANQGAENLSTISGS